MSRRSLAQALQRGASLLNSGAVPSVANGELRVATEAVRCEPR